MAADKNDTSYVLLGDEEAAAQEQPAPVVADVVTDGQVVYFAEQAPPPSKRRNGCCACFGKCCAITLAVVGCIALLIAVWVNTAYGQTSVEIQSTPLQLDYVIQATAGLTDTTLLVRLKNVNNFDTTYKDLNVDVKLKQGGEKQNLAKYASASGDSVTIKPGERANLAVVFQHIVNATAVANLEATCTAKGWSKLRVKGNLHMKGGWNTQWSRQAVKSNFNKCMPCKCGDTEFCGQSAICPKDLPDDDINPRWKDDDE